MIRRADVATRAGTVISLRRIVAVVALTRSGSVRLADKHKVHRRTVRAALAAAVPPARKPPARTAPMLGPYEDLIRGWLVADLTAPRKQRHTARRVWQRLLEEHGAVVAESSVRSLVAQLRVEVGGAKAQVMVPQTHRRILAIIATAVVRSSRSAS